MCGRLSLFAALSALAERFEAEAAADLAYEPRYNVAPRQELLVVPDADPDTITTRQWGLLAPWADGPGGPRRINARAETVAEKPTFREAFAERRCLVLADGFYEWQADRGHSQPYRICREDAEPFAFAGLWNRWEGGDEAADDGTASGEALETVAIVTTGANDVVEPVHDRMPVVLEPGAEREWLRADPDDALALLEPYSGDDLRAYPVSKRVNDPANDDPGLVEEVAAEEQTGLEEFGA